MAAEFYIRSVTVHISLDPVFVSLVKTDPPPRQVVISWKYVWLGWWLVVFCAHTCVAEMWYLRPRVQIWRALPPFGTV